MDFLKESQEAWSEWRAKVEENQRASELAEWNKRAGTLRWIVKAYFGITIPPEAFDDCDKSKSPRFDVGGGVAFIAAEPGTVGGIYAEVQIEEKPGVVRFVLSLLNEIYKNADEKIQAERLRRNMALFWDLFLQEKQVALAMEYEKTQPKTPAKEKTRAERVLENLEAVLREVNW